MIVGSNGHIVVNDYGVTCNLTAKSRTDKSVSSTCQIQTRSKQDDLLYSVRNLNGQSPDSSKENDKQEIISADINNSRQIDVDELNYVPGKRSGKYKWDKTLFYTLEDADENNEEDNQINTYRVTHKKFIHAKTKNEIEYEIYHHPESDKVHKMVSIEKDETVLHITEYYFTDDGKVNFIYCYEDTNYVPSYAKLSKKGVRYLFHNDTMVNWRIVNAEGEINYCYGKKEKKALSEHKKVVEYSKLSQETRKQYDNCEKVMLNRAYNTFEKVNHFEGVSSICGYVCDENGTGMADASGQILYKTDQLEANYCYPGEMRQPVKKLASVSFQDVDNDRDTDIILIVQCHNDRGDYQEESYKVGDVLFQDDGNFYRDYRISDKINRFDMNKNPACILNFVRDGRSTEFLYTAETLADLLNHNFNVIEEQSYTRNFEKLGKLKVVPGTYRMAEYDVFMIYLIDEQGNIVWSFQPMEDYDNLYALKGIQGKDLDGDGLKDLVVFAKYSYEGENGELLVDTVCTIYYQRTAGFEKDTDFTENYECTEEDTLEALVTKIRAYWGWQT